MKICTTFKDRLIGNMFKKEIIDMCFPKCNSIHTFFMLKPIDVYMLDKNFKVLFVLKNVKSYKFILPKKNVFYTIETEINKYNFKINETLDIKRDFK